MPLAVVLWFKIACEAKRLWVLFGVFVLSVLVSILLTEIHQKPPTLWFLVGHMNFLIGSILSVLLMKYGKALVPSKMVSNFVFLYQYHHNNFIVNFLSMLNWHSQVIWPGSLSSVSTGLALVRSIPCC